MKILITGGSGFIGTNLTDYYVRKGWNVKNVDVKAPKQVEMTSIWTQCDITDKAALSWVSSLTISCIWLPVLIWTERALTTIRRIPRELKTSCRYLLS